MSEQAPPAAKAKEKPDRIPLPNELKEEKQIIKKKQNPEEVKPEIRQASEFEKKEIIDTNQIAALIDKAKEEEAVKQKKSDKITQSNKKNSFASGLNLSRKGIVVFLNGTVTFIPLIFSFFISLIRDLISSSLTCLLS